MTPPHAPNVRRGFALIELTAILVAAGVLLVLLLVLGGESRRQARLGEDIAKLRRIGAWTGSYGADNSDLFWSFSWKANIVYHSTSWSMPTWVASTDLQAAANQAVDILHRRADRHDIAPISGWIPQVVYSHLVVEDYLGSPVPDFTVISSMDKHRIRWARDPKGFDAGLYQPAPSPPNGPGSNTGKRWPYSPSFQVPPAFFDGSSVPNRIYQGPNHNHYFVPVGTQGARLQSAVAFPSSKVFLYDQYGRHFGHRIPYFGYPEARLPLLFADGSVRVVTSSDANIGWHPNQPAAAGSPYPMPYNYAPDVWEPPTLGGLALEQITRGAFRWTRGTATEHGIAGRDYDGAETCSGQPGCP